MQVNTKFEEVVLKVTNQLQQSKESIELLVYFTNEISFQIHPIIKFENLTDSKMTNIPIDKLLGLNYKSLLYISGDGNCFYRAFMIDYLIQIFAS